MLGSPWCGSARFGPTGCVALGWRMESRPLPVAIVAEQPAGEDVRVTARAPPVARPPCWQPGRRRRHRAGGHRRHVADEATADARCRVHLVLTAALKMPLNTADVNHYPLGGRYGRTREQQSGVTAIVCVRYRRGDCRIFQPSRPSHPHAKAVCHLLRVGVGGACHIERRLQSRHGSAHRPHHCSDGLLAATSRARLPREVGLEVADRARPRASLGEALDGDARLMRDRAGVQDRDGGLRGRCVRRLHVEHDVD